LDPQNLGAVLRSAFFLGVDAVVLSSHGAPLTAATLKASAGAAEVLPILTVHDTGYFIRASQRHGWHFYAAVPLQHGSGLPEKPTYTLGSLDSPLRKVPCVAMLGGEGTGLWKDLQHKADSLVTIHGPRAGQAGVDSLNVSVSAALLAEAFMRQPVPPTLNRRLWDI
jgi:21S rRNA (GM2251-2'-O)-methyltransferase